MPVYVLHIIFLNSKYTNGQKKGYTVYMLNYSLVNLEHSIVLT